MELHCSHMKLREPHYADHSAKDYKVLLVDILQKHWADEMVQIHQCLETLGLVMKLGLTHLLDNPAEGLLREVGKRVVAHLWEGTMCHHHHQLLMGMHHQRTVD